MEEAGIKPGKPILLLIIKDGEIINQIGMSLLPNMDHRLILSQIITHFGLLITFHINNNMLLHNTIRHHILDITILMVNKDKITMTILMMIGTAKIGTMMMIGIGE